MATKKKATIPPGPDRDWWRTYFSDLYAHLYRGPLKRDLSTAEDLAVLRRLFGRLKAPLLDLACGFGRHLEPLLERGLDGVGVDYSADLLRDAPGVRGRVSRGDLRALPFRDCAFGGAWLLFNSFGYFDDDGNEDVLAEVARVLRPGARLLMDLPCRPGMRAAVKELDAPIERQHGDSEIVEAWRLEANRLEGAGHWTVAAREQPWTLSIRLHTPTEIARLLARAGFGEVEIRPLEQMSLLARRDPPPSRTSPEWRSNSSMIVLAKRA